jgi:hypothetical protein
MNLIHFLFNFKIIEAISAISKLEKEDIKEFSAIICYFALLND